MDINTSLSEFLSLYVQLSMGDKVSDIRLAKKTDIEEIVRLQIRDFEAYKYLLPVSMVDSILNRVREPDYMKTLSAQLKLKNVNLFLVQEGKDNKLSGFAQGQIYAGVSELGHVSFMWSDDVESSSRDLLEAYFKYSRSKNAHKVTTYTPSSLKQYIKIYVENGFIPEGFLQNHFFSVDLLIMSRDLKTRIPSRSEF
ncbi:MAG: hypothetical protein ACFFCZ_05875 [Promethearchaeota archaeon]